MFWWNFDISEELLSLKLWSVKYRVSGDVRCISWRLVSFCFRWEPENPQCVWNLLLRRLLHIDCEITQTQAEALDMTRYDMWLLLSPLRIYFWIQWTQSKLRMLWPSGALTIQKQSRHFSSSRSRITSHSHFWWPRPTQRVLSLADNVCDHGRFMVYHQWMMVVLVLKMAVNIFTVHIRLAHGYHVVRKK